jgi:hypothetical protein
MNTFKLLPMTLAFTLAAICAQVSAQDAAAKVDAPATRAQVKMEAADFMKSHRWEGENWVFKSNVEAPAGVKSRADVKADTVQFHRTHEIDDATQEGVNKPVAKAAGK